MFLCIQIKFSQPYRFIKFILLSKKQCSMRIYAIPNTECSVSIQLPYNTGSLKNNLLPYDVRCKIYFAVKKRLVYFPLLLLLKHILRKKI